MYATVNFRCILGADGYDSTITLNVEIVDGAGTISTDTETVALQS